MDLLGQCVRRSQVRVALDERAAGDKYGIVRRGDPRHALRYGTGPAGTADEIVAGRGPRDAFADVGEVRVVRRIGELDAVVATGHVRYVQDLRAVLEVQPA